MSRSISDEERIAEEAILKAKLAILQALKNLSSEKRQKVMQAVTYICMADECVPGVLAKVAGK